MKHFGNLSPPTVALAFCLAAMAWPLTGAARAAGTALVISKEMPSYRQAANGFREVFTGGVQEYVLSANSGKDSRSIFLAMERQSPDVIVAVGAKALVEAREAFPNLPLVYCMVVNPRRQDLPGQGPVYGVQFMVSDANALNAYKAAYPPLKRLGFISSRADPEKLNSLTSAGKDLQIEIVHRIAGSNAELPAILRSLSGQVDSFWMTTDPALTNQFAFDTLSSFCLSSKIPLFVPVDALVAGGAFMAATASYSSMGADAAEIAAAVLSGRTPSPDVRSPSNVQIHINLKTAERIGLSLPDKTVDSATKVYR